MTSCTQRTLAECRRLGYVAWIVEKWNPHAHVRQDMFGWADILAFRMDEPGVLGIQTTSTGASSRKKKVEEWEHLSAWLFCGNRAEVWSWRKLVIKPHGKRKKGAKPKVKWTLRRIDVDGS